MMGGIVSDVGSFLQDNVVTPVSNLGVGVDQAVGQVPGGWMTVGGLAAGGAGLLAGAGAAAGAGLGELAAADMAGLVASGISESQAASIIASQYGIDSFVAADMAGLAAQGLSPTQIATTIGQSGYSPELLGLAQQAGVDTSTIGNLVKQYGSQAIKSLLTTGGAQAVKSLAGSTGNTGLLSGAANAALSASQLAQLRQAYSQNVGGQQQATQQAVSQAGFTPVGTTTAFGTSNFGFDPVTGKLTSAGYTATPELAAQRQRLFGLGAEALPTTANTQDVQQQYIAQQQGLLAPGREQALAQLQNKQFQTGTTGLATGGTMSGYAPGQTGLMQTNPQLAAYYNSLAQQDAQLAANAPTYAQNQLNQQIATGTGLFGAANTLESYAQQPLSLSSALGTAASTAGAKSGYYGLLGNQAALATQLQGQQANIYGTGQAVGTLANPILTAAQGGLNTAIGNWLS